MLEAGVVDTIKRMIASCAGMPIVDITCKSVTRIVQRALAGAEINNYKVVCDATNNKMDGSTNTLYVDVENDNAVMRFKLEGYSVDVAALGSR